MSNAIIYLRMSGQEAKGILREGVDMRLYISPDWKDIVVHKRLPASGGK